MIRSTTIAKRWLAVLAAASAGPMTLGAFVALGADYAVLDAIQPTALAGALACLLILVLIGCWHVVLGLLLIWLVFEDLVRKFSGNNLMVYFAKDAIYAGTLFLIVRRGGFIKVWRAATGSSRFWFHGLLGWAAVLSLPTALQDWRIPLMGLRLDFFYAPLVVAGFALSQNGERLRRWLVGLSFLGAVASSVGIAQEVLGPDFLQPSGPTPGLLHLTLLRNIPGGVAFYQPSGTFVSSGRFNSMAVLSTAMALGAFLCTEGRVRIAAAAAILVTTVGVWVSGGRIAALALVGVVASAVLGTWIGRTRSGLGSGVVVTGLMIAGLMLVGIISPASLATRMIWFQETLDPRSPMNELGRWRWYAEDTVRGLTLGGLIGQGTGTESLGKQYLFDDPTLPVARSQLEAGYGQVAAEWGLVGLLLWSIWTISWLLRSWQAVRLAPDKSLQASATVLFAWVFLFLVVWFYGGLQFFQNYYTNAYFWLVSGMMFGLRSAGSQMPADSLFRTGAKVRPRFRQ